MPCRLVVIFPKSKRYMLYQILWVFFSLKIQKVFAYHQMFLTNWIQNIVINNAQCISTSTLQHHEQQICHLLWCIYFRDILIECIVFCLGWLWSLRAYKDRQQFWLQYWDMQSIQIRSLNRFEFLMVAIQL